ncbi:MAG: hypothetical protein FJ387_27730 [Verrucomicrobia bacterium]|nr:hypothetical protein [Verrucomicrobiota bacterium]
MAIGDAQRQRVAKVLQDHPTPPPNAPGWPLLETAILDNPPGEATLVRPHQQKGLPVVDPERQPLQDNHLTTWDTGADRGTTGGQTEVVIATPGHPLAAGLAAGVHTVSTVPDAFSWGMPGPTATVVATLNDGFLNPCIYGYEKGAFLVDSTTRAPERRVMVFLGDPTYSIDDILQGAQSSARRKPLWTQEAAARGGLRARRASAVTQE